MLWFPFLEWKVKVLVAQSFYDRLFATPWTVASQAPLSMKFSRQEYWSGLPFPPPRDLPDWGLNLDLLNYGQTFSVWATISVQFSRSVTSDSLQPHESQHARPPCPSPTLGVHSNSCPSSRWCHPAISSSVIPFSPCPQSLPASGSFQMSQLFVSGGQSIGVSASAPVLSKNTQDWSPLEWTAWISL